MVIARRRYSRRRLIRRRRPMRMLKAVRPYKKITNFVHRFVRWTQAVTSFPTPETGPVFINSQNISQHFSYSFALRNAVNAVDFTALYDQYRINKVTMYLERQLNQTGAITVNNPNNQRIRVVHDYNDNNLLTSEDDYLEYSNCKSYQVVGGGAIKIVLYPKVANELENVSGGTAFEAKSSKKVWINTVDDQVPHFGVKIFVPSFVTSEGITLFRVRVRYDLSFKNSK